jgi:hypothetical protein
VSELEGQAAELVVHRQAIAVGLMHKNRRRTLSRQIDLLAQVVAERLQKGKTDAVLVPGAVRMMVATVDVGAFMAEDVWRPGVAATLLDINQRMLGGQG